MLRLLDDNSRLVGPLEGNVSGDVVDGRHKSFGDEFVGSKLQQLTTNTNNSRNVNNCTDEDNMGTID